MRKMVHCFIPLVLIGMLVLCTPLLADGKVHSPKECAHAISQVKPTLASPETSMPAPTGKTIISILKYCFRSWFGLPFTIVEGKPPIPDEPQKSGTDPHKPWTDIARDHGWNEDDL